MIQKIIDMIATCVARAEALTHANAVILPNFPRSIQYNDSFTCGAKAVFCILRYYGINISVKKVERILHTDEDGTAVSDIKRVFKKHGLKCRTLQKPGLQELKAAIDDEHPVLITLYDSEHYAVVYGFSKTHIIVMNPSLGSMGSFRCAIPIAEFREVWDRWGIVISK